MTARSDLADLISASAPTTWEVYPYPVRLGSFAEDEKPVAIVIEQRSITSGVFSDTAESIPVQVVLSVWVVVDGGRGDEAFLIEERLEEATEEMIRILSPLPDHVWDGTAERGSYDPAKPSYQFTISAPGALTNEE